MRKLWFVFVALGVLLLALLLAVSVHAQDNEGDPNAFQMPYPNYFIADNDCHSDGWGAWCALDPNSIPDGGPLFSPITGVVIAKGENDGYTNTYICLQNNRWRVCMLHGLYNLVNLDDWVTIGQQLGTEASIGNSTGAHTHLSVYDRSLGAWIDPRTALSGSNAGFTASSDQSQDTSIHPQPGPVNWSTIGVEAPGKFLPEITATPPLAQEIREYWQATYIQNENPLRTYLSDIHWIWFVLLTVCLLILMGSRGSRHWWPLWLVLLAIAVISFIWSRLPSAQQIVLPDPPPRLSDVEVELVLPDPPSGSHTYGGECLIYGSYPQSILQWCSLITQYALEYGHDPNLIAAVMLQESGGQAEILSHSGAVGLMQIMPRDGVAAGFMCTNGPCFSNRPTVEELNNPEFNVQFGTRMLAGLINRTGNVRDALKSYGPMDVGYNYADKVLGIYQSHIPQETP